MTAEDFLKTGERPTEWSTAVVITTIGWITWMVSTAVLNLVGALLAWMVQSGAIYAPFFYLSGGTVALMVLWLYRYYRCGRNRPGLITVRWDARVEWGTLVLGILLALAVDVM